MNDRAEHKRLRALADIAKDIRLGAEDGPVSRALVRYLIAYSDAAGSRKTQDCTGIQQLAGCISAIVAAGHLVLGVWIDEPGGMALLTGLQVRSPMPGVGSAPA